MYSVFMDLHLCNIYLFSDQSNPDAAMMLYVFLLIVLYLNKKRNDAGQPVDDNFLFKSPEEFIHSIVSILRIPSV